MTLGEKLKTHRLDKNLSQEKIAEIVGVSRQAVTKWESNQSAPSAENLIALSSVYGISLDELVDNKSKDQRKDNKIVQANLTLVAILLQAAFLNVCIQPLASEAQGSEYVFLFLFKLMPLLACSIWMAHNLRYEKNIVQYRKNVKIELCYCSIQLCVALFAYYSNLLFIGALILVAVCLIYIFIINPQYMNRVMTKQKTKNN